MSSRPGAGGGVAPEPTGTPVLEPATGATAEDTALTDPVPADRPNPTGDGRWLAVGVSIALLLLIAIAGALSLQLVRPGRHSPAGAR